MAEPGTDFDEFVRGRSATLLRTAYLFTTDRQEAEDLLQEVLERLYVKWRRINGAPEAYARRILTNQAINRWRRRSRRVRETPLYDQAGESVDDHADRIAVRGTVLHALRQLPMRQRVAVVLRYLDDLSEADTARIMGCSAGTVKSHTARGLARLRLELPEAAFEPTAGSGPRRRP